MKRFCRAKPRHKRFNLAKRGISDKVYNLKVLIMNERNKFVKIVNVLSATAMLVFFAFFIYMSFFENISVYQAREPRSFYTIENIDEKVIKDSAAPAGIKKEYTFVIDDADTNENCLAFYVVHHYAEVYFDNELIYSLNVDENNKIGRTPSSNWVVVPIYPQDSSVVVKVVAVPVYHSVINRDIIFKFGSYHEIFMNQLVMDLPQLILSFLCLVLGIFMVTLYGYFKYNKKQYKSDLLYLGVFSVLLAVWRITDTRIAPLLFTSNEMVLGYISVGVLFIGALPLLLFVRNRIDKAKALPLNITAAIVSIIAIFAVLYQVSGRMEIRELIVLSHISLIASLAMIVLTLLIAEKSNRSKKRYKSLYFVLLLVCGGISDILIFYAKGNSSGVFYTMIAFAIYAVIVAYTNIKEIQDKAYIDVHTGLVNKNYWDEITKRNMKRNSMIGIMMFDLNCLKYVNDTYGHESGDRLIFHFANILRNSVSPENVICRWGGDEFTILLSNTSHESLEKYAQAIENAVDRYNNTTEYLKIYYSEGHALSSDFDSLTYDQLLQKADNMMYNNKKIWYSQNNNVYKE